MKKAIIIGASSGIGSALAEMLAKNNYNVGILARRGALLHELKQQHPNNFEVEIVDVTINDKLFLALDRLVERLGGIDLLVYSAGIGELNEELSVEKELPTIEVNVEAFTKVMVWAYQLFKSQKSGQIACITSIGGLRGGAAAPAYNASKAYQINYLEGLRQKANKHRDHVNILDIRAGFVDTAMAKGDKKFWVASPQKAASQIYDAICAKRNVIYVSKRWIIVAWLLKIIPRSIYIKM